MQERYRGVLCRVRKNLQREMLTYFVERGLVEGDVPGESFWDTLEIAGLCQADAVLCCLRLNTDSSLRLAEKLIGKRITRCPPALSGWRWRPHETQRREGDERIVRSVRQPQAREMGRRRLLSSPLYDRLSRARPGMSVAALVSRGLRRRDLRIALRRGYLELSA
jgi:hypothetical protein